MKTLISAQEELREMLSLNKPIYEKTAAYGHFGRDSEEKWRVFMGKNR